MIPKIIHYCWFGGNPLPKSAQRCIDSWKKFFPEYEIKEWNEQNYDVYTKPKYVQQAYQTKKWAFVSDYARFDILSQYGGIYFDTDVEVIRPMDDIIEMGSFMGCESDGIKIDDNGTTDNKLTVAPGLGIAVNPGLGIAVNPIYKEILESYANDEFILTEKSFQMKTVVARVTEILTNHGLKNECCIQTIEGIKIYPKEYFNPMNMDTMTIHKTNNTRTIHWYDASWLSEDEKDCQKRSIKKFKMQKITKLPNRILTKMLGLKNYEKIKTIVKRK